MVSLVGDFRVSRLVFKTVLPQDLLSQSGS